MISETALVKDLLGEMRTGEPRSEGALTLIPFFAAAPAKDYHLAAESAALGLIQIEEIGGGHVPNVVIHNRGEFPVLLIDGEHLEGAKQSRIINVSALIAARSRTVLPVSCVEQGRWRYTGAKGFTPSGDHSYARLRGMQADASAVAATSGLERRPRQDAVWREVASKHSEMGVRSATGAMRDSYDQHRSALRAIEQTFARPEAGQTGVLASIGGEPLVLDALDRPETLSKLWSRLLSGYALDALRVSPLEPAREVAGTFIIEALTGEFSVHDPVGLGTDVVIASSSVVGNALTWEGGVVHLSLFRRSGTGGTGPSKSRIARPVARRSMRRHFHA
jgi:hypothetical protein